MLQFIEELQEMASSATILIMLNDSTANKQSIPLAK
tara:strand:+ start:116 stop:223 length:108 start_codon:yes stop_codon:yes gene_type:complete